MKENTKAIIKMMVNLLVPKDRRSRGKHNKATIDHYIEVICYVLRTGIQWKQLQKKLHYTTYHKKFMKWCKYKVFENAYKVLIRILRSQNYLTDDDLKNLYIDSSMIKNVHGSKNLGVNHYDRGRKGNKVNVIVTKTGIPISMSLTTSNEHDIKQVEPVIDEVNVKIIGSRLIGDKGYISKRLKSKLRQNRQIYLVTPKKKGQALIHLPEIHRKLLSKRNIVENYFGVGK